MLGQPNAICRTKELKPFLAHLFRRDHEDNRLPAPLADFLHGRRPPIATAEEGRTSLRMTLACYVSTREGRRVRIDDESVARV